MLDNILGAGAIKMEQEITMSTQTTIKFISIGVAIVVLYFFAKKYV